MNTVLWLTTALALAAPAVKDKAKPPASLVGEWVVESCIVGGNPSPSSNRWVFAADGSRAIYDGEKELARGSYTTDPKANLAVLDLDPGGAAGSYPCIYRVDGDTLTVNVGWQKSERPAAFESAAGSMCTLYVMKRVKKEERP